MAEKQNRFKVVDDSTVDNWNKIDFATLTTQPYDLRNTNYYITLGLFDYDTSMLQMYAPDKYEKFFATGAYDGWSLGSVLYFGYYKFTD